MKRRIALRTIMMSIAAIYAAPSSPATSDAPPGTRTRWSLWKSDFLSVDGRVIDDENGGISHSESQGYGALLAQANGDHEAFERIEGWTRTNLLVRQDHLMAWRWREEKGVSDNDWHTATDGDLFRAWALLRAARDSGWTDDMARARDIARDIALLCLRPDPRAPQSPLLTPGAEARSEPGRVLFNPSYIMPRALRELGIASETPYLTAAADHGETVLSELAATGAMPDWVDVTSTGFAPPREHDLRSGHDALRVPLYLVWSGNRRHPAVARAAATFALGDAPGHVAVETTIAGQVRVQSNLPGYRAIQALADCRGAHPSDEGHPRQSYYPATLELLAEVAHRESTACATE